MLPVTHQPGEYLRLLSELNVKYNFSENDSYNNLRRMKTQRYKNNP